MKTVGRPETWIHTHFLADCTRLSLHHVREIESSIEMLPRSLGIVFGILHEQAQGEKTLRIVLECLPLPSAIAQPVSAGKTPSS